MGEGAARPPIGAWLAGLSQMAAAFAASAAMLAERSAEDEPADQLWAALEGQFTLWRANAASFAASARSVAGRETLERLMDPAHWLFGGSEAPDAVIVRLVMGAEVGAPAGFGREALRRTPEWAALRRARGRHRALVAGAWRACFERMATEAAALDSIEAWLDVWEDVAGEALDGLHADPAFLASMRDLVMAAVALREAEAGLVEAFCAAHGLPTRREVDDLHRTVTALRRDLRALRRDRDGG